MKCMTSNEFRYRRQKSAESTSRMFRVRHRRATLTELPARAFATERSLQRLIERHLGQLMEIHFVASEYPVGARHQGRIDTLGLDQSRAPVVIEYKRERSANLITQGLFYLDWLEEHRGDFRLLVEEQLGAGAGAAISWDQTRLVCVAIAFDRYDVRAVRQIGRRIDLIRYEWFGDDLFCLTSVAVH